jgi:predicted component of type VI protein secretion system
MPGPFIFIATNRLRDGRFGAEQQRVPGLSQFIEANEPRLIAFHEYVNEDHSEVTVVQVHPDAASLEFHIGIIGDLPGKPTPRHWRPRRASRSSERRPETSCECSASRPDRESR